MGGASASTFLLFSDDLFEPLLGSMDLRLDIERSAMGYIVCLEQLRIPLLADPKTATESISAVILPRLFQQQAETKQTSFSSSNVAPFLRFRIPYASSGLILRENLD